ncbi:MAG: hypothetical protein ABR552_08375 [Actinomycetota bacterium]|nr:hypothetical protein [Actinomycetota bacterium]
MRDAIAGLPEAANYTLMVKPLRYRTQPRLSGLTEFEMRTITCQIPEPFYPFGDVVVYGSTRLAAKGMKFVPLSEGITFRTRAEVVRFLYCHEWYHWYLWEHLGKRSFGETACDRFAVRNWHRRTVTFDDAAAALRRR